MFAPDPIRVLHFSDVHFGVENYGKPDAATGLSSRLIDFRNSLVFCIERAIADGIELAIFTGDAYKSRDPSQTHQREFGRCIGLLASAGIPVVLLAGNHDISNARGRANSIEIFGSLASDKVIVADKPTLIAVTTATGRTVQIAALPYLTKSNVLSNDQLGGQGVAYTTQLVVTKYEEAIDYLATLARRSPNLPTVFMGHFSVASAKIGSLQTSYLTNEPEVPRSSLMRPEFDYVALGHIHKFQDLNAGYQPPIVYSGSIDRIDFGERSEAKGAVLVDVTRGHCTYRFLEAPVRPFIELDVDTSRGKDPTEKVLDAIAQVDLDGAVVKLTYHVRPEDDPLIDDRRIHAALNSAFIRVSVRKEVAGASLSRRVFDPAEAVSPLQAFEVYLDRRPDLTNKREELTSRAKILIEELLEEESA